MISAQITLCSVPCNLIGSNWCDLFLNHSIFCFKSHLFPSQCRGSRRTSSQGTGPSAPSVAAHEELRPKGPVSLPQVSRLMKNLVPRDPSVCPKCRGSRRTSSQGTSQSAPSVAAHEVPRPKGPVSLPQVSRLTKNLVPRDLSVCPKCRGSQRTSSLVMVMYFPSYFDLVR